MNELSSLGADPPEAVASGDLASKLIADPAAVERLDEAVAAGLDIRNADAVRAWVGEQPPGSGWEPHGEGELRRVAPLTSYADFPEEFAGTDPGDVMQVWRQGAERPVFTTRDVLEARDGE